MNNLEIAAKAIEALIKNRRGEWLESYLDDAQLFADEIRRGEVNIDQIISREDFFKFLKEASAQVDTWPDWKKSGANAGYSHG